MNLRPQSVGVVSVATNRYLKYWGEMAKTADPLLFPDHDVTLHVFTDQPELARRIGAKLERIHVVPVLIEDTKWPGSALRKFALISEHEAQLTEDLLIHLDADMLISSQVGSELDPSTWISGIALVRHPGYRRVKNQMNQGKKTKDFSIIARDFGRRLKYGANGTWETRRESQAFVPRDKRFDYVCGATWMGTRDSFVNMCSVLADRTETDLHNDVVAVWHDESHLNWWAAEKDCSILDSDYCYVLGASNLSDLNPRIIAVEKGEDRTK